MLLVQDNKLSLDDKISKYFPDVRAKWKDITVWNLLTGYVILGILIRKITGKYYGSKREFSNRCT